MQGGGITRRSRPEVGPWSELANIPGRVQDRDAPHRLLAKLIVQRDRSHHDFRPGLTDGPGVFPLVRGGAAG